MKYLYFKQVLFIYKRIIEETGGKGGIASENLLRSALSRPRASFAGKDLYPYLFEKISALGYSLINNHPFIDGNKRLGLVCMRIMLKINGYNFKVSDNKKYDFIQAIANKKINLYEIADYLQEYSQK